MWASWLKGVGEDGKGARQTCDHGGKMGHDPRTGWTKYVDLLPWTEDPDDWEDAQEEGGSNSPIGMERILELWDSRKRRSGT